MNRSASLIATLLLATLLSACGEDVTPQQHVDSARALLAADDLNAASIELKNALQKEPANAQARMLLGTVHWRNGDVLAADKELRRALKLGAPDGEVLGYLSKVMLATGEYKELEELNAIGLPEETQATVLASQAGAKIAEGDMPAALELLEAALAQQGNSVYARLTKARYFAANSEFDRARAELDKVLALEADNDQALSLLGDIALQQQDFAGAEEAYGRAVDSSANALDVRLKRAFVLIQMGDYEKAELDLQQLLQVAPQHPGVNYAQGLVHFYNQNFQDAITAFAIAEREKNRYPMSMLFAGTAHYMLGNSDQAYGYADQFHAIAPENIAGSKLLATILLGENKPGKVEALMRPVVASYPEDVAALNLLSNALMMQGNTDEAIELLNTVARLEPESTVAQIRLGAGLLLGGEQGGGVERLETALQLNPEFQQADILLVLNYVQQKDFDKALEAAEAYQRRNPISATPSNLLGRVLLAAGRDEEARAAFNQALELESGDPAALSNLAQMAITEKNYELASEYYDTLLENRPAHLQTLMKLAELEALEGDTQGMIVRLQEAMEAHPAALQPRIVLARYALASKNPEQVAVLFADLDDVQKNVAPVLNVLALAQLSQKDYAGARFNLEKLVKIQPDSAPVRHQLAMAAAGLNDKKELNEQLEKAIELSPDYLPSRLALTRFYLANGETETARLNMEKLRELAPDQPDVMQLDAAFARLDGNQELALQITRNTFEAFPGTASLLNYTAQMRQMGDNAGATSQLELWLKENAEDSAARLSLAELYTQNGQQAKTLDQYKAILKVDDANMIALNNLAWYLQDTDPKAALKYAERALAVMPDSADVLDTLALAQMKNGDNQRAKRSIDKALDLRPKQPTMRYHRAMIYAEAGEVPVAKRELAGLLDSGVEFPEKKEAEQLLNRL